MASDSLLTTSNDTEAAVLLAPASKPLSYRRMGVRLFVLAMSAIILIETLPRDWGGKSIGGIAQAKTHLSPWTSRLGLWQGEWPLFAPNPVLNNAWVSADIRERQGATIHWNSTYWATASSWEKFRHFRKVNYFNRMPFRGSSVAYDFADYIARQELGRDVQAVETDVNGRSNATWTMQLNHNQLNMSPPNDGPLPSREETIWIATSSHLATRGYEP
jgi:hypothetical protein